MSRDHTHPRPGWSAAKPGRLVAFLLLLVVRTYLPCRADDTPIVVLRVDDNSWTWRVPYAGLGGSTPYAYAKQKRIPITWAVITNTATNNQGINWQELRAYVADCGGEIASHSCSHQTMVTQQQYIDELVNSKAVIEANCPGLQCKTFIQPGVWTNDAYMDAYSELDNPIGQAIQQNYSQSMAYLAAGWTVGTNAYRYGNASTLSIDYSATTTLAAFQRAIDLCVATPGCILVIYCHAIQETGGTQAYTTRADVFKAVIDRLADLRDSQQVRLVSLDEAYHTTFSPGLNHAVDPGFEICSPPLSTLEPVTLYSHSYVAQSGGVGNSKYAVVPDRDSSVRNTTLLPPGRYRISWSQRPEPGTPPNKSLTLDSACWMAGNGGQLLTNYARFSNSTSDWERRSVLVQVLQGYETVNLFFRMESDNAYGVDDLSVVAEPLDPAVSPTNTTISAAPFRCTFSWDTPNDPSVTNISICYGSRYHPNTPSEGTPVITVPAVPGTRQQVTIVPMNWPPVWAAFYSIFAIRGNTPSPPDLLAVTFAGPTAPQVTASDETDGTVSASWTSTTANVYGYSYAVGHQNQKADVVGWTQTSATSADIEIPLGSVDGELYLSVKAENCYGVWSSATSVSLGTFDSLIGAFTRQDGVSVRVSGIVSAIFGDCVYIESADRTRGLKVTGCLDAHEGQSILVSGVMSSSGGERSLVINPHPN